MRETSGLGLGNFDFKYLFVSLECLTLFMSLFRTVSLNRIRSRSVNYLHDFSVLYIFDLMGESYNLVL